MEVTGKIIQVLPEQSGTSKAGRAWKKREYVLETFDQYPQKIMFDFFGERADQFPLEVGQIIKLSFDINSREFNNRWYTNISGWRAENVEAPNGSTDIPQGPSTMGSSQQMNNSPYDNVPVLPTNETAGGSTDDLPF